MIHAPAIERKSPDARRRPQYSAMTVLKPRSMDGSRPSELRQRIGNHGIQRLMGDVAGHSNGGAHVRSPASYAKRAVSQPGDAHEQEADRVASAVMRMPAPGAQEMRPVSAAASKAEVQRLCAECEEESEKKTGAGAQAAAGTQVRRKEQAAPSSLVTPAVAANIEAMHGGGSALPAASREFFEPRFGADFSQVRLHTDARAAGAAESINAKAFTVGQDIAFGAGQYAPESSQGQHLLAHELTHVVQQNGGQLPGNSLRESGLVRRFTAGGEGSERPIQQKVTKEHGVINDAPDDILSECNGLGDATPGVASEQKMPGVQYAIESDKIDPKIALALNQFAKDWHDRGGKEKVDIFGYASTDGPEGSNWTLSCKRANSVKNILMHPTDKAPGIPESFITTHAQGETNKFSASETDFPSNRVATIVSSVPLKPADPCPPCPTKGLRPPGCPLCFPILPDNPIPDKPLGPVKPPGSPALFCVPYTDIAEAQLDHFVTRAQMKAFTSKFGSDVQNLWITYLDNPKKGTKGVLPARKLFKNPASQIVKEFRDDNETRVQKNRIMKLIAERVQADPNLVPAVGNSTPILNFRAVLNDAELLDLPMSFKDPADRIPGNIAGGFGKNSSDAGADVRNVDGTFIATNQGFAIQIIAAFEFDIFDAIDFCPGAPGGFFAQVVTIPMSRFEATPDFPTYDVPFEVIYSLVDKDAF